MQRGVCMSPPFPRPEPVCNASQLTEQEGYNFEMHSFEWIDYTKHTSKEALVREHQLRHHRLRNCTHDWDLEELKVIMKPADQMGSGW